MRAARAFKITRSDRGARSLPRVIVIWTCASGKMPELASQAAKVGGSPAKSLEPSLSLTIGILALQVMIENTTPKCFSVSSAKRWLDSKWKFELLTPVDRSLTYYQKHPTKITHDWEANQMGSTGALVNGDTIYVFVMPLPCLMRPICASNELFMCSTVGSVCRAFRLLFEARRRRARSQTARAFWWARWDRTSRW